MPRDDADAGDALAQIYAAGMRPDWWKLPPLRLATPNGSASPPSSTRNDPHCRGVLVLGLEASEEDLDRSFRIAAPHAVCRGFAVGRSIFADAAAAGSPAAWTTTDVIADIAGRYARLIALWDEARAGVPEVLDATTLKWRRTT